MVLRGSSASLRSRFGARLSWRCGCSGPRIGVAKLSLTIQAADVRQLHVQDEAGWQIGLRLRDVRSDRSECDGRQVKRGEQLDATLHVREWHRQQHRRLSHVSPLVFWGELIATLLHAASTSGIRALSPCRRRLWASLTG